MADVERERVTALWREAADALAGPTSVSLASGIPAQTRPDAARYAEDQMSELRAALAECGRLREQLDAARQALEPFAALPTDAPFLNLKLGDIHRARAALGVEGEQE